MALGDVIVADRVYKYDDGKMIAHENEQGVRIEEVWSDLRTYNLDARWKQADERQGGHACRVMAAYERWPGPGPELAILRLLGLFDRPAEDEAIAALHQPRRPRAVSAQNAPDIQRTYRISG